MEVLGVTYDHRLTFKMHIESLAREASGKLASLQRMSWLLDRRGLEVLYKAHVRSSLEYVCLAWGSATNKYLALLDKIQARVARLIGKNDGGRVPQLQHWWDVVGLTVMFKVRVKWVRHLQALWQPPRQVQINTRVIIVTLSDMAPSAPIQKQIHRLVEHLINNKDKPWIWKCVPSVFQGICK